MHDENRLSHTSGTVWDYALQLYGELEVQHACLNLQETAGVDVCVLLAALRSTHLSGRSIDTPLVERMDAAVQAWREEVVQPLRRIRQTMKRSARLGVGQDADTLRNGVKALELKAERLELDELATHIEQLAASKSPAVRDDFAKTVLEVVAFYKPGPRLLDDDLFRQARILADAAAALAGSS